MFNAKYDVYKIAYFVLTSYNQYIQIFSKRNTLGIEQFSKM